MEGFPMSESKEKRMVADTGYEVVHAIHIGDREILIAENMNDQDGQFYMKAEYSENGIIGQYDRIIYSNSYLTAMEEFAGGLDRQIVSLRAEIFKNNYAPHPITAAMCHPHDYGQNLNGKVVAIKAEVLRREYRREDRQLVWVDGGNGARGNARGTAVFCYRLSDGQHTRFERYDVLGEIKVLPDWAKERLAAIQAEREATSQASQAPAGQEKVAGYTITERIQVGNKQFVLGENPDAVSPFVTWQHMDGRTGYDWGHYHQSHDKALADLLSRADKERNSTEPDREHRQKGCDDAR
jgi:hypothetical protein